MDADVVNDLNVRKALSLAIDRSTITDQILRDGSVPASAFVAPPFKLSTGESMRALDENGNVVEEYEIDPYSAKVEEAQAYLAEAGYPGGAGFPELNVLYYDSGNNSLIVEAVQQMWQENLGIKVNLQVQEYAVFTNTINSGDWSIAFTGWSADYNDPMTMLSLFTAEGMNDVRWRYKPYSGVPGDTILNPENEAYDNAVKMAAKTSGEERDAYLKEAEDVLMENMVICPIHYTTYTQVTRHGKDLPAPKHTSQPVGLPVLYGDRLSRGAPHATCRAWGAPFLSGILYQPPREYGIIAKYYGLAIMLLSNWGERCVRHVDQRFGGRGRSQQSDYQISAEGGLLSVRVTCGEDAVQGLDKPTDLWVIRHYAPGHRRLHRLSGGTEEESQQLCDLHFCPQIGY